MKHSIARWTRYRLWVLCALLPSCYGGTTVLAPAVPLSARDDTTLVSVERVVIDSSSVRFELAADASRRYRSARLTSAEGACDQGLPGEVAQSDGSIVVDFPIAAASPILEAPSRLVLLLDATQGGCVAVPLERQPAHSTFTPTRWGFGWAGRLRPAGQPTAHFGSSAALELGVDHWFRRTRVRLGVEVSVAGCGDARSESDRCASQQFVGLALDGAHPIAETTALELALSLGYVGREVLTTEPADAPAVDPIFLHGPRARVLLLPGRWAADWMGDANQNRFIGIEFGAELLQRGWLRDLSWVPSFGWVGSYAF